MPDALLGGGAVLVATVGALVGLGIAFREPAALPALLAGAAMAIFLLAGPQWIVPAFVGLTWAALPGHVFGGLPSPVEVGGLLLLAFALWRALEQLELAGHVLLVMLLLAIPLAASALLSPEGSTVPVKDLRELLFLFIPALCVFGAGSDERVAIALVVVALVLGVGGIFSVLIGPTELFPVLSESSAVVLEPEAPRAAGPFGEPNFYALSMAALTPLALFSVTRGDWRRLLGFATLVAIAGGILAAGSRGAAFAMFFALVAFGVATPNRQVRTAVVATLLAAVALVPLFASQANSSVSRSVGGRESENRIALEMVADHPLLGVGPGGYPGLYRDYARKYGDDPRPTREPHSLPLEIASEQGIVGILGWLTAAVVFLSYVFARKIWSTALGRGLLLSVATYLVGSLFLHGSQVRLLFLLLGLTFACAAQLETTSSARSRPS